MWAQNLKTTSLLLSALAHLAYLTDYGPVTGHLCTCSLPPLRQNSADRLLLLAAEAQGLEVFNELQHRLVYSDLRGLLDRLFGQPGFYLLLDTQEKLTVQRVAAEYRLVKKIHRHATGY